MKNMPLVVQECEDGIYIACTAEGCTDRERFFSADILSRVEAFSDFADMETAGARMLRMIRHVAIMHGPTPPRVRIPGIFKTDAGVDYGPLEEMLQERFDEDWRKRNS